MSTSVGIRSIQCIATPLGYALPLLGIVLVASALVFSARQPPSVDLETLDPALMKAVQASVSQRDIRAILSGRRAGGPVHLQLYTSCDKAQRCTILTTMDFPRSPSQPSVLSLQVAVQVARGAGNVQRTATSAWEVRSIGLALDEHIDYQGNFHDLAVLPRNGERDAMVSLLASIRSAVAKVLVANGVTTKPDPVESMATVH